MSEAKKKSNRKYIKGKPIKSLDELMKQEFVFFHDKVTHIGWFGSWQVRTADNFIKRGFLFRAKKVKEIKR